MVRVIPAHIENGHVVPETPLPAASNIRKVSILVEIAEPRPEAKESTLPKLLGLLKDVDDPRKEYRDYLDRKYS